MDVTLLEVPQRWELYRVLAEPVRLRMLALVAEEELAIGEIAELLGESQPNVSRHVGPLRQLVLVVLRREGTRSLVSLRDASDPVVADALRSGRALCEADGSLARLGEIVRSRDAVAREYFERPRGRESGGPPSELGAYLAALAPLIPHRALAIDAGTGEGSLLEVLAPVFEKVVAVDRSEAQLAMARARVKHRAFSNVDIVRGEIDQKDLLRSYGGKADAVFAARLLHHAPRPAEVVIKLAELMRPGGILIVLDYARHDDERMREQADLWLGFEPAELKKFARAAGLESPHVAKIPPALHSGGPDSHLPWQLFCATKAQRT
ncbi:metalloregulator ArsR/SmtB family transcription factor [soil metagenome]